MKSKKLFIISCLISTLGSSLTNIILAYRFLLETNQGVEYGLLIYASLTSAIILIPFIGSKIDSSVTSPKILLPLNISLGIAFILLAHLKAIQYALIIIFFTTALDATCRSVIFKTLPTIFEDKKLIKINSLLQEIFTFGFIFGPLAGPALKAFFKNDIPLFYIDAISFFIAGIGYYVCFHKVRLSLNKKKKAKSNAKTNNFINDYYFSIKDKRIKNFILGFLLYMMAFSPMAYSLALIAKKASNNIELLYTLPILSMFAGRMIALRYFKKLFNKNNLIKFLFFGLIFCGLAIFPLSFIENIYIICLIEFFLGMAIAIVKVTEVSYSQLICPNENLAKLSSAKDTISILAKSISIAMVIMMMRLNIDYCISPFIALFFIMSSFYFVAFQPFNIRDKIRI